MQRFNLNSTLWFRRFDFTFIARSINLESQAGRGGSWEICNGFDPSDSSILIMTLCTEAVPVFLPNIC